MSFGIVHHFPGGTKEHYDAVLAKVGGGKGKMPEGELHHAAGATDQGWLVSVIWESQAKYDDFMQNTLGPALAELGDKAFPNPPYISTFEVYNEMHA